MVGCLDGNDIILYNRDGIDTKLKFIADNKYLLITEIPSIGVTYDGTDKNTIIAVDPAGGPYLYVGEEIIDNVFVANISHSKEFFGFIIEADKK